MRNFREFALRTRAAATTCLLGILLRILTPTQTLRLAAENLPAAGTDGLKWLHHCAASLLCLGRPETARMLRDSLLSAAETFPVEEQSGRLEALRSNAQEVALALRRRKLSTEAPQLALIEFEMEEEIGEHGELLLTAEHYVFVSAGGARLSVADAELEDLWQESAEGAANIDLVRLRQVTGGRLGTPAELESLSSAVRELCHAQYWHNADTSVELKPHVPALHRAHDFSGGNASSTRT